GSAPAGPRCPARPAPPRRRRRWLRREWRPCAPWRTSRGGQIAPRYGAIGPKHGAIVKSGAITPGNGAIPGTAGQRAGLPLRMPDFEVQVLLQTPLVEVRAVLCAGTCRHKGAVEQSARTTLVFPYRGTYVRHAGG